MSDDVESTASTPQPKEELDEKPSSKPEKTYDSADGKKKTRLSVRLMDVSGQLIESQQFQAFNHACEQIKVDPTKQPIWMIEFSGKIMALGVEHPMSLGYQKVSQPWRGVLTKLGAKVLSFWNVLKPLSNGVQLPNGAQLPFEPEKWVNAQGKEVDLFQAYKMPDGRWVKVDRLHSNRLFSVKEKQVVRQAVESITRKVEQEGATREVNLEEKKQESEKTPVENVNPEKPVQNLDKGRSANPFEISIS